MQRALGLGSYLARHGVSVDLVYQGQPEIASRESALRGFRRVFRVQGWGTWLDDQILGGYEEFYLRHETPGHHLLPSPALCSLVRALLDGLDYRAVLCTYAWTAPILSAASDGLLRILDVQDVMFLHGSRCEAVTGHSTTFSLNEATERYLWSRWDVLLAITREEGEILRPHLSESQRLMVVPHAIGRFAERAAPGSAGVLYTGSDNASNIHALRWFLGEVWPFVLAQRPHTTLEIAGLICRAIEGEVRDVPGVRLLGFVDSTADLVREAAVVIAPYLFGSGLKIKVVEAAASGKAIVTTSHGLPGTAMGHEEQLLVGDTPAEFAAATLRLLESDALRGRLGQRALATAKSTFAEDVCYSGVLATVRAAAPPVRDRSRQLHREARQVVRALRTLDGGRLVLWGNGSHTRKLMTALGPLGVRADAIVDGRAETRSVSPEGAPILPKGEFRATEDDLIVLSSEAFEGEMWRDLTPQRDSGAHVLALYHPTLVTPGLRRRLMASPDRG